MKRRESGAADLFAATAIWVASFHRGGAADEAIAELLELSTLIRDAGTEGYLACLLKRRP